jgi:hypothetical protein
MTAVPYDHVVATPPAPRQASKRLSQPPIGGGDLLVDATARLLGIPLRQVYAVLWRLGLLEVR